MTDHSGGQSAAGTVEFPPEFTAWLDLLEIVDPHAFESFRRGAEIDLT